ncbi:MAG: chemotaxis protein CheA [Gallionellales bacterium 35-53-114]|jgi:two-component system chemotaxis sensor kinase CheA|nr:MAG: chemotaxis protein CheA [Gallionellales bacterium 35-53-114]OYZ64250.1 MAG: chemotaxis protein CheA [Gallionellales bacterium 24-53-125]OZB10441.1 MAG: chemotaxis protein CheA [Gallionellales bacterium 39-52-133]HQS57056.1 chemotaxis protein CheW [Gallionellaceae bacterium]HQS74756.1 chemotaxis protein CheW [Gallionellaceae bacterium]
MNFDLSQFYQVFFEEAGEHLASMESLLLALDVADPDMDELNAIFRAAHSIKGGAGTFGFTDMTEVTHILETLLDKLRKQEMQLTTEMVDAFLQAGDAISMQLASHRGEGEVDQQVIREICEKLEQLTGAPVAAVKETQVASESTSTKKTKKKAEKESAPEQEDYGFFDPLPSECVADEGYGFFGDAPNETASADDGYGFFTEVIAPVAAPVAEAAAAPAMIANAAHPTRRASDKVAASSAETSIRVSVEKVDQLINLVGELVITQAMLAQSASTLDVAALEQLQNGLNQLERNTRDIQESIMSVRMLPISFVFSRFPRVVRDVAGKLNKQVELKTLGESTELDKALIEKIADPLTHLIRNSLDHGIESPDKRIAAGKSAHGTITLNAFHQGGSIVIEVADDGGGLNRGKILGKAKERGLPVSDSMSDEAVWMLIFEAGFSTADVVTDVSGRGVGMDVVKRNIAEMGGRVELSSAEGHGTRTTIRLPLTLAILDGMSVAVGGQTFILPLGSIVESLQITDEELKTVSGDGRLLRVRGEYLPLIALHEVFAISNAITEPKQGIAVIVEAEGKKTALLVDELLGQHQVVIKSLESNFRKVPGMSGATIMGDGTVALILDVLALSSHHVAGLAKAA